MKVQTTVFESRGAAAWYRLSRRVLGCIVLVVGVGCASESAMVHELDATATDGYRLDAAAGVEECLEPVAKPPTCPSTGYILEKILKNTKDCRWVLGSYRTREQPDVLRYYCNYECFPGCPL